MTNRLLIEGGFSSNVERYNNLYQPGIEKPYRSAAWLGNARHVDSQPIAAGAMATALNGSGGSYLLPASIIQGRLLRIGAVVTW